MKKTSLFSVLLLLTVFSVYAQANVTNVNLNDLEHKNFYIWQVTIPVVPKDQIITNASIVFENINNWRVENDILYVHLLSNSQIGDARNNLGMKKMNIRGSSIYRGNDKNPAVQYDDLTGYGSLLTTYEDKNEYKKNRRWINPPETYTYNFTKDQLLTLNNYIANDGVSGYDVFGIGVDSDCHYRDHGFKFTWGCGRTPPPPPPPIPAPGAVLLGGIGVCLVGWMRRRKTL